MDEMKEDEKEVVGLSRKDGGSQRGLQVAGKGGRDSRRGW